MDKNWLESKAGWTRRLSNSDKRMTFGGLTREQRANHTTLFVLLSLLSSAPFLFTGVTWATELKQIEQELNATYKDKLLTLRNPMLGKNLRYDEAGKFIKGGPPGSWTVASSIEVSRIRVGNDTVRIDGKRVAYLYDRQAKQLGGIKTDTVRVDIGLKEIPTSAASVQMIMPNVFLSPEEGIEDIAPDYWKPFLSPEARQARLQKTKGVASITDPAYKGITPPIPTYKPEPPFLREVPQRQVKGYIVLWVVVDRQGNVADIWLVKPIGLGLDETAVETVRTWKFKPAVFEGKPVSCRVLVEMLVTK